MNNHYLLHDKLLLSYTVASGDLYPCDVGVRNVYLLDHPMHGLIVRGEMQGCGPESDAGLSQILLEYALTCEGCDPAAVQESMTHFGANLGTLIADKLLIVEPDMPETERLNYAIHMVLVSMMVPFKRERTAFSMRYCLGHCPLDDEARRIGLVGNIALALRGFVAMLDGIVRHLAPDWTVVKPSLEIKEPLMEISVMRQ